MKPLTLELSDDGRLLAACGQRVARSRGARPDRLLRSGAGRGLGLGFKQDEGLSRIARPLVDVVLTDLILMHRLQVGYHTAPVSVSRWPDSAERAVGLLKKAVPHLPHRVIAFRVDLAWETILGSLSTAAGLPAPDRERYADELVDYLAGALDAPQSQEDSE